MRKETRWKAGFFALLTFMLVAVIIIAMMLFWPAKQEPLPKSKNKEKDYVGFTVHSNKHDLTQIINHYIEKEKLNGPINYEIILKDDVELYGEIEVFSKTIDLHMTFEPKALENGDLILYQKSASVGKMNLPVSYILKFIRNSYNLPSWVIIQPKDEWIYVSLEKMELKGDMKVKADKFNLKEDDITLTFMVDVVK